MRDQVIRQELECKKGVNILWQTEPYGWLNRIMDYGQDRYEARDEAVLDRKWIIAVPYKQSMKWIAEKIQRTEHVVRKTIERILTTHTANRRWKSAFNRVYSSFIEHRQRTGIVTPIASHPPSLIHVNHVQSEFHQRSSSHPILLSSSHGFA